MPLKIGLGPDGSFEVGGEGDLGKLLQPGIDTVAKLSPLIASAPTARVQDLPDGSLSTTFSFSFGSSWKLPDGVGITLTVKPSAVCTLSFLKPGDTLFQYVTGPDSGPIPVQAGGFYVGIGLKCGLAIDGDAKWSSGAFGVSGSVSTDEEFEIANYCAVDGAAPVGEALRQAFSQFVLPFHAESIRGLPAGNYVDFEFIGKLALGFGATYGFSGVFLGGRSNGEVKASANSAIGTAVATAKPGFQAGAGFKFKYSHEDRFRIVAERNAPGANLYLMRKKSNTVGLTETFGITVSANAKFKMDPATLKSEASSAVKNTLPGNIGATLGDRIGGVADQAVGAVDEAVNNLLQETGDGHKIQLQLTQERTHENTTLFIYNFDFSKGTAGYGVAMKGDFAAAIAMDGVELDPRSFIEQLYRTRSGLDLQIFDLLHFRDITEYLAKTDVFYVGDRTFQIRTTEGVKSISGIFGKEREADLYFIAQCRSVSGSLDVTDLSVRLNAVLLDKSNPQAFQESARMLEAMGLNDAAGQVAPANGTVKITLDIDVSKLRALQADDPFDYEQWVQFADVIIGRGTAPARIFQESFPLYADWAAFNRAVNGFAPGDAPDKRLRGNANGDVWPDGKPPQDRTMRLLVQTYIFGGQAFMNLCAALQKLIGDLSLTETKAEYEALCDQLQGMVRHDLPYPTYFLKPSLAALMSAAGVPVTPAMVAVSVTPAITATA